MQFIKKFFKKKNKKSIDKINSENDKCNLETDELFIINFKEKGGKFFYPKDMEELSAQLTALLHIENKDKYSTVERSYYHFLKKIKIPVTDKISKSGIVLGGCEYLLATEGNILTTSKQTNDLRNQDMSQTRVIIATTDQITKDKREALEKINSKYEDYPSNIQSISAFKETEDDLQAKWIKTYLFLIEK